MNPTSPVRRTLEQEAAHQYPDLVEGNSPINAQVTALLRQGFLHGALFMQERHNRHALALINEAPSRYPTNWTHQWEGSDLTMTDTNEPARTAYLAAIEDLWSIEE